MLLLLLMLFSQTLSLYSFLCVDDRLTNMVIGVGDEFDSTDTVAFDLTNFV